MFLFFIHQIYMSEYVQNLYIINSDPRSKIGFFDINHLVNKFNTLNQKEIMSKLTKYKNDKSDDVLDKIYLDYIRYFFELLEKHGVCLTPNIILLKNNNMQTNINIDTKIECCFGMLYHDKTNWPKIAMEEFFHYKKAIYYFDKWLIGFYDKCIEKDKTLIFRFLFNFRIFHGNSNAHMKKDSNIEFLTDLRYINLLNCITKYINNPTIFCDIQITIICDVNYNMLLDKKYLKSNKYLTKNLFMPSITNRINLIKEISNIKISKCINTKLNYHSFYDPEEFTTKHLTKDGLSPSDITNLHITGKEYKENIDKDIVLILKLIDNEIKKTNKQKRRMHLQNENI